MKTIKKIPGNQLEGWFIANASDDQEVNGVVWTEPNVANGKRSTVIFLDRPLNDSCISLLSSFLVMERERWGIYDSDSPGTDCRWWISTEPCMTLISSREKSLFQVILELQSRQVIKNCLAIGEMTKNIDE
jgi:hypothetical protein